MQHVTGSIEMSDTFATSISIILNTNKMNSTFPIIAIAYISMLLGIGCNKSQDKPEESKVLAEEHNEAKFDNTAKENDSQFLVDAAEINLEEIQFGQLAAQKGSMDNVKELGLMMEKAHNKSMADLTVLASKKMITIPTSVSDNAKKTVDKLTQKSAEEFDEAYCDMMVKKHKEAIELFEKAATEASDAEIRLWASSGIPTLKTHLDHAVICQKTTEKLNK